jgi:hypothetical protein
MACISGLREYEWPASGLSFQKSQGRVPFVYSTLSNGDPSPRRSSRPSSFSAWSDNSGAGEAASVIGISSSLMTISSTACPGPSGKSICDRGNLSVCVLFVGGIGSGRWNAGMNQAHPRGNDPKWNLTFISRARSRTSSVLGTR